MISFFSKTEKLLSGKNEGQFVFNIASLFLGLITFAILSTAILNGANVIQNLPNFSDSAKLLFALVAFFIFAGIFMAMTSSSSNYSGS